MKTSYFLSIFLFLLSLGIYAGDESSPASETDEQPAQPSKKPKTVVITPIKDITYKMIPLKSLDYSTVERMCKPLLSKDGIITYEEKRASILVGDYPENIEKIMKFLVQVDTDAVNIRIDIDSMNTGSSSGGGLNADFDFGKGQHNQVIIVNGKVQKPEKITVDAAITSGREIKNTKQFVVTKSGYPATIFVGKTIADPAWLETYKMIPSTVIISGGTTVFVPTAVPGFVMRNVGATLMALPRLREDGLIEVEIYPEISYIDGKGKNQAVKVENIVTKMTVQEGQRINIGGVVSSNKKFYTNLFGPQFISKDDSSNALDIYLTAKVLKTSDRKAGKPGEKNAVDRGEDPYNWR